MQVNMLMFQVVHISSDWWNLGQYVYISGCTYQFRLLAVYSNNDNRQGPNSGRFTLESRRPQTLTTAPVIVEVLPQSPNNISVKWQVCSSPSSLSTTTKSFHDFRTCMSWMVTSRINFLHSTRSWASFLFAPKSFTYHRHQLNILFLPRLIKGMDGCFPTALGRQSTFSNNLGPLV